MTNILNYIRNIIKILIWPIIFIIGQFLLIIIFNAIFNTNKYNEIKLANQNLSKEEYTIIYNDYIKSNDYQNELNKFIDNNTTESIKRMTEIKKSVKKSLVNYKIFIMRMKLRKKGLHENLVMLISPYKR